MNTIIIIGMLLIGFACYFIGLKRGITGSQHLYDDGWIAAEDYFKRFPELVQDLNEETERDSNRKYEIIKQVVSELDELFQDSDENADSSPQEAPETTRNEKMTGNTTEK